MKSKKELTEIAAEVKELVYQSALEAEKLVGMSLKDFAKGFTNKLMTKSQAERQQKFEEHISENIKTLFDNSKEISWETYQSLTMNSYERKYLLPKLSKDALLALLSKHYVHSSFTPAGQYELPITYDEVITKDIIPEIIKRL